MVCICLESGNIILANNVINSLNTFFHQPLSHPNRWWIYVQMLRIERLKLNENPLLGYLNINSLRNKIIDLREIIHYLNLDYFVLSETKIDSSFPSAQFAINNYEIKA